jgi:hypothetical protein
MDELHPPHPNINLRFHIAKNELTSLKMQVFEPFIDVML